MRQVIKGAEIEYDPKPGVPYRCGAYDSGGQRSHLINPSHDDLFFCGRTVWPDPDQLEKIFGSDPWWLVEDSRKNAQVCGTCKRLHRRWVDRETIRRRQAAKQAKPMYETEAHPDELVGIAERMVADAAPNPWVSHLDDPAWNERGAADEHVSAPESVPNPFL